MTPEQLAQATGATVPLAQQWLEPMLEAMERWEINTAARQADFLAQVGVESDHLRGDAENLNYSAAALRVEWPTHFTAEQAQQYGRTAAHPANQQMIANIAYADRYGNGAPETGDGWLFRGRPLLGTTFRDNYRATGQALSLDLEGNPDLLLIPQHAAGAAGWFWQSHGCNELSDAGRFVQITHEINGGLTDYSARWALRAMARKVLNA
jgi:putative chitinase